jgi:hypothetical protein
MARKLLLMLWTAPPPASPYATVAVLFRNRMGGEPSREEIATIGLDIAKSVFEVHAISATGGVRRLTFEVVYEA